MGFNFSVAVWHGYIALFDIAVETGAFHGNLPARGVDPSGRLATKGLFR
jgi:hypothetical protein